MLAKELGITVHTLTSTMSIDEYWGWKKYYSEQPSLSQTNEVQLAMLMSMVANMFGGKAKMQDFMLSKTAETKYVKPVPFDAFNAVAKDFNPGGKDGS